jgi:acetyl esterase/lipase
MTSLRANIVRAVTGAYFSAAGVHKANVQVRRRRLHALANVLWTAKGVTTERGQINGLKAEWLTPRQSSKGKLLLYLHGGAYIMGNCATHRQLVSHIARAAGVRALIPEYRLAPEHPFPAAVDDAVGVYRALLAGGYRAGNVIIAGDSAGGGLTMATLLSLRDADDPLPAAACLLSPFLDLAATGESMTTRAYSDPWFKPEDMPIVASCYCDESELSHPLVSPVYADLSGLPPLYIQVGADEILLSDSTRAADKVKVAGGKVDIEIWPDMWHVFQVFVHQMPESRDAIRKLGIYIRQALRCAPAAP